MNFIVTDPQGNTYTVTGLMKFTIDHNLSFESLRRVAAGLSRGYRGWKCEYTDPIKKAKADAILKGKLEKRGWVILTPDGRQLLTTNLTKFCKKHSINYYNLRQSAITNKGYEDYRCFYASKRKRQYYKKLGSKWEVTDPDGIKTIITNLKAFCRNYNIEYGKLLRTCKTEKIYNGWRCKQINKKHTL